ncbi:MAG: PKD domain-containing protein [Bacteroidota bacterium]
MKKVLFNLKSLSIIALLMFALILTNSCKKDNTNNSPTQLAPIASFTFTQNSQNVPSVATFTNTSQNATSYSWNFGDGASSTDVNPTHTYTQSGTYSVILTAIGNGGSNTNTQTVYVGVTPPTRLQLNLKDNIGNVVSGATVKLYASLSDWTNGTNQVGTTQISDAAGNVMFSNLSSTYYYWFAENGCSNNANSGNTTSNPLNANVINYGSTILSSTGTLKFVNTSTNPYHVYINGVLSFDMNGGTTKYKYYVPIGYYTLRVLQISGYVLYPTDETFTGTISCGTTLTTTYP